MDWITKKVSTVVETAKESFKNAIFTAIDSNIRRGTELAVRSMNAPSEQDAANARKFLNVENK